MIADEGRYLCADSLAWTLLAAVAGTPGDWNRRVPLLGRHDRVPRERRHAELAREAYQEAVPYDVAAEVDAEAIAAWIVGRYHASAYSSVLLGSPHGSAAHLAVAVGAAWLPTSIPMTVNWPGGSAGDWPGALAWGAGLAARINRRNPGITVRQVHDPLRDGPLCGSTVRLHLRFHTLPRAYGEFLRTRVAGSTLLLRDLRTWPVLSVTARHGFQIGSPVAGRLPSDYSLSSAEFQRALDDLRITTWSDPDPAVPPRYCERSSEPALGIDLDQLGRPSHRVLYTRPDMLSASVADLLRRTDTVSCVVECGRLLDPWRARAGGLVPYWCEQATAAAVEAAEWWLAGSAGFECVTVLPGAPGYDGDRVATLAHWRSLSSFGRSRAPLDRFVASRYPMLPAATQNATRVISGTSVLPPPPAMTMSYALSRLQSNGGALGLLVS